MIRLKYPNIDGNSLCDGRIHNITPYSISRIEDLELYIMDYFDESIQNECSTILSKNPNGVIEKIPLLDYDLLFDMVYNNQLRLTEEDPFIFLINYKEPNTYINNRKPLKDFGECLTQARAAIILYIDSNGNIYYKDGSNLIKVTGEQLLQIMQLYDIEWHRKETNELASKEEIESAINNATRGLVTHEPHSNGVSYEERYNIGNIHHYTVGYQYKDVKGFTRFNSSV